MNSGSKPITWLISRWLLRKAASVSVRRIAALSAAVATDVGNVRDENQDRAAVLRGLDQAGNEFVVLAVADGIGSMQEGAACAALTIGSFFEAITGAASSVHLSSRDWLRAAAFEASKTVHSQFRAEGGATLVALLLRKNEQPYWLSVGDSRVYRQDGKKVSQVSIDDTIAGQLGKGDVAEVEQAKLLQFMGMEGELEPHVAEFEGELPESVLLTTDGVHYLSHASFWFDLLIVNAPEPGLCAKRLVDLARWCGGPDNASVVMVRLPYEAQREVPEVGCLEVWDAFGELQLALPPSPAITHHQVERSVEKEPPPAPPRLAPERHPKEPTSMKSARATKKSAAKKRKPSSPDEQKAKKGGGDTSAPELFVEFPENTK